MKKEQKSKEGKGLALQWFSGNKIDYRSSKGEYQFLGIPQKEWVSATIHFSKTLQIEDEIEFGDELKPVVRTPYYITSPEKVIEHYGNPFFFAIDTFESFGSTLRRISYLNNVKYPKVGFFKLTKERWKEMLYHLLQNPTICRMGVDWDGKEFVSNDRKFKRALAYGMKLWKDPKEVVDFEKTFKFTVWNTSGIREMLRRSRVMQIGENKITAKERRDFKATYKAFGATAPELGEYHINPKKLSFDGLSKDFMDLFRKMQWVPHTTRIDENIRMSISATIGANVKPTHQIIAEFIGVSLSTVRRALNRSSLLKKEFLEAKIEVDRNQIAQAKELLIENKKKITVNAIQRITDPRLTKGAIKSYLDE